MVIMNLNLLPFNGYNEPQCIAIPQLQWSCLASFSQRQEIIWLFSLTEGGKIHLNFHRSHPFTNSQGLEIGRTFPQNFKNHRNPGDMEGDATHPTSLASGWVRGAQCRQTLHPESAHTNHNEWKLSNLTQLLLVINAVKHCIQNQWQLNNFTQPPLVIIRLQ